MRAFCLLFVVVQSCLWGGVGELFVAPFLVRGDEAHRRDLERLVREGMVGGVLVKGGSPFEAAAAIAWINSVSSEPLLIFIDAEWGLGMRMEDAVSFPRNLTLGALDDDHLIYEIGKSIGGHMRLMGAHVNLAPVVDVNAGEINPMIHMRSFGSDPKLVAKKGVLMMEGLQASGVSACLKHFPGHGYTKVDSHWALPIIEQEIDLIPFQAGIDAGAAFVMTGHLVAPYLTKGEHIPATLSYAIVTKLLKDKMGFKGIVITDALNMKGLTEGRSPEEIAIGALRAGHDLLLYGDHIAVNVDEILQETIPRAFRAVKELVDRGELLIDESIGKIRAAKGSLGLYEEDRFFMLPQMMELFKDEAACALKKKTFAAVIKGENPRYYPLKGAFSYIALGEDSGFGKQLSMPQESIEGRPLEKRVVIGVFPDRTSLRGPLGMLPEWVATINQLSKEHQVIVVFFSSPNTLRMIDPGIDILADIVIGYEADPDAFEAVIALLLGAPDISSM